jgi:ubiquinone/menaquinone biosynthesis C-methylase UbiE
MGKNLGSFSQMMRRQWDERAETNACYYIKSDLKEWDIEQYFKTGADEVHRLLDGPLSLSAVDPQNAVLLEIGCGNGRMTKELCRLFREVYALDVSERMHGQAKENLKDCRNVHFVLGNGVDLSVFDSAMFNYCFSYTVFQHLPTREIAFGYVREIFRTLKPAGIARFQFNGYWKTLIERYPKKYILRSLQSVGIKRQDQLMSGYFDTCVGAYVSKRAMYRHMIKSGFESVAIQDFGGTDIWAEGKHPE